MGIYGSMGNYIDFVVYRRPQIYLCVVLKMVLAKSMGKQGKYK